MLRPFSSRERGLFVSVDGPSGVGKSTIVRGLARMLVVAGGQVHVTAEPSDGPIGLLYRELTESASGHSLACLYAADRPDLAVILEADPGVTSERLAERWPRNRFQLSASSCHAEVHFYRQADDRLIQAGFDPLRVNCGQRPAEQSAGSIRDRLLAFFGSPSMGEDTS